MSSSPLPSTLPFPPRMKKIHHLVYPRMTGDSSDDDDDDQSWIIPRSQHTGQYSHDIDGDTQQARTPEFTIPSDDECSEEYLSGGKEDARQTHYSELAEQSDDGDAEEYPDNGNKGAWNMDSFEPAELPGDGLNEESSDKGDGEARWMRSSEYAESEGSAADSSDQPGQQPNNYGCRDDLADDGERPMVPEPGLVYQDAAQLEYSQHSEESLGSEQSAASPVDGGEKANTSSYSIHVVESLPVNDQAFSVDWKGLHGASIWPRVRTARLLIHPKVTDLRIIPRGDQARFERWVSVDGHHPFYSRTPARVLIVASGPKQLGCTLINGNKMGRFTFNSEADNVIFDNYSDRPFAFTPLVGLRGERPVLVLPNDRALIDRGTWVLAIDGKPVIEFEVLRRMLCEINHKVASKRAAPTDGERAKRRKLLSPAEEYVYTSVVGRNRSGNPIFYVNDGETLFCSGFQLKRQKTIFENRNVLVWRGEYHGLHGKEECVVKTLKSGDRDPVEVAQVWEREYDILKAVQYHPNIVRLVGADFRLHSFYLEHIDAKALSNQMKSNTSFTGTREDARRIMRDIASALAQIHAKGFAHGDVKPGNILYGPEHGAVLIDLGTAFPIIDPARFGGTPWYMPPEFTRNYQLRGAPGDVFALAVTSGWLTGHLQFPEKTWESWHIADIHPDEPTEGHRQAMDAMSHWLKHVRIAQSNLRETDPLENVIFKALDADRKTRISAAMICEELDRINLMDD